MMSTYMSRIDGMLNSRLQALKQDVRSDIADLRRKYSRLPSRDNAEHAKGIAVVTATATASYASSSTASSPSRSCPRSSVIDFISTTAPRSSASPNSCAAASVCATTATDISLPATASAPSASGDIPNPKHTPTAARSASSTTTASTRSTASTSSWVAASVRAATPTSVPAAAPLACTSASATTASSTSLLTPDTRHVVLSLTTPAPTICSTCGPNHNTGGEDVLVMPSPSGSVPTSIILPPEYSPSPPHEPLDVLELVSVSPTNCSTNCSGDDTDKPYPESPTDYTTTSSLMSAAAAAHGPELTMQAGLSPSTYSSSSAREDAIDTVDNYTMEVLMDTEDMLLTTPAPSQSLTSQSLQLFPTTPLLSRVLDIQSLQPFVNLEPQKTATERCLSICFSVEMDMLELIFRQVGHGTVEKKVLVLRPMPWSSFTYQFEADYPWYVARLLVELSCVRSVIPISTTHVGWMHKMVLNSSGTWFDIVRPYSAYPILKKMRTISGHVYKQLLVSRIPRTHRVVPANDAKSWFPSCLVLLLLRRVCSLQAWFGCHVNGSINPMSAELESSSASTPLNLDSVVVLSKGQERMVLLAGIHSSYQVHPWNGFVPHDVYSSSSEFFLWKIAWAFSWGYSDGGTALRKLVEAEGFYMLFDTLEHKLSLVKLLPTYLTLWPSETSHFLFLVVSDPGDMMCSLQNFMFVPHYVTNSAWFISPWDPGVKNLGLITVDTLTGFMQFMRILAFEQQILSKLKFKESEDYTVQSAVEAMALQSICSLYTGATRCAICLGTIHWRVPWLLDYELIPCELQHFQGYGCLNLRLARGRAKILGGSIASGQAHCSYKCSVFDNSHLKTMAECSVIGLNASGASIATWQIWQGRNCVAMLLDYNELQATLLVDGITACSFCFIATNKRGTIPTIRIIQLHWDPGDSLNLDMIHLAADINPYHMMLLLPWDPGGCAITLSLQHINKDKRALSKRTIVHALHLCMPWDPGSFAWFRLEGKPKIMGGGMSATWALLGLQQPTSPARRHKRLYVHREAATPNSAWTGRRLRPRLDSGLG